MSIFLHTENSSETVDGDNVEYVDDLGSSSHLILFSMLCFAAATSTILSSRPCICSSASAILLLIPSTVHLCVCSSVLLGLW